MLMKLRGALALPSKLSLALIQSFFDEDPSLDVIYWDEKLMICDVIA
jgi:hypothetical protein